MIQLTGSRHVRICRDSSKRFCPSCGNPSLLRTTVTVNAKTGQLKIHLKKNFQYHLRGSKYTIPDAKPGRAKGQQKGGTGLILREDQAEWQNAVRYQDKKKEKEERRAAKGALDGWNDPDVSGPEFFSVIVVMHERGTAEVGLCSGCPRSLRWACRVKVGAVDKACRRLDTVDGIPIKRDKNDEQIQQHHTPSTHHQHTINTPSTHHQHTISSSSHHRHS